LKQKSRVKSFDRHKNPRVNPSDDRNKTTQKTDDLAKRLNKKGMKSKAKVSVQNKIFQFE